MGAIFAGIGAGAILMGSLSSFCISESNYFCIKVRARDVDGREVRVLYLDALLHSYVDLDDPLYLRYSYEKVFADLATYAARGNPDLKTLFIGGGGYTLPRFMETMFPGSGLEVVEIDPQVTQVAIDYLGLDRQTRIVTYNEDARTRLQRLEEGRYDLVIGDAFNDVSVPYHLTTLEFNDQLRSLLTPDGIYAVNIVDKMYSGRFLRSFVTTLQRTFPHVYLMRDDALWESDDRYTFVVVGSLQPVISIRVQEANLLEGRGFPVTEIMAPEAMGEWLGSRDNTLLTDDFVPVDGMLAPLYLDSR
jgi:spermidine synthase